MVLLDMYMRITDGDTCVATEDVCPRARHSTGSLTAMDRFSSKATHVSINFSVQLPSRVTPPSAVNVESACLCSNSIISSVFGVFKKIILL